MKKAYQLHDTESQEILGAVIVTKTDKDLNPNLNVNFADPYEELVDGWETWNKLEEHDGDPMNVAQFVSWFNSMYVTQIEEIEISFIQIE